MSNLGHSAGSKSVPADDGWDEVFPRCSRNRHVVSWRAGSDERDDGGGPRAHSSDRKPYSIGGSGSHYGAVVLDRGFVDGLCQRRNYAGSCVWPVWVSESPTH